MTNITPDLGYMQTSLVTIVRDLSALLDTEYDVLSENTPDTEHKMRPLVEQKQILADEYAAYCALFHALPDDMKDGMVEFAKDHVLLLQRFSQKLKRNFVLIEARYKRSEMRIDAVLNAIRTEGETAPPTYGAKANNVVPLRGPFSHDIAS